MTGKVSDELRKRVAKEKDKINSQDRSRSQSNESVKSGNASSLVVNDNDITSLKALIKSDFEMAAKDKDFKLTHEQLIKAVKIILYKMNLVNKKNKYR